MRLTQIVRIGGRLALMAAVLVLNLARAESITYFWGYSSPGLTKWQAEDAFAGQNVQFVYPVSMVSYGNPSAANGYTGVSTTNDSVYGDWSYNSSSFGTTAPSFNPTSFGGFGAYNPIPTSYGSDTGYYSPVTYTNVNGLASWNAWQQPPAGGVTEPPQIVAWQPIQYNLVPPVTSNFANPTVLPDIVPPSTYTPPGGLTDPAALGTPEPASVGLMAAGLLGLLYLRRRR
jgi:hypothetical protein